MIINLISALPTWVMCLAFAALIGASYATGWLVGATETF